MFSRRSKDRTGTPADLLAVGLGNPGDKYAATRHNVGAEAIDVLADRYGIQLKPSKQAALQAETNRRGQRIALAFPQTFMNDSGRSVRDLMRRHGIDDVTTSLVIVHDELDLEVGVVKVKLGGGLAGHNGLKSITQHTKTQDYARVRIGIGRPPGSQSVSDYVLRRPGKKDRVELDIAIERAADAVESILELGVEATMNEFNR